MSPSKICKEQIFTEFEILYYHLIKRVPSFSDKCSAKARLLESSNEYASLIAERDFLAWQSVHFRTIKAWRSRNDAHITKPDKFSGVVILNIQEYLDKMTKILSDSSKLKMIGLAGMYDNTSRVEVRTQMFALSTQEQHYL